VLYHLFMALDRHLDNVCNLRRCVLGLCTFLHQYFALGLKAIKFFPDNAWVDSGFDRVDETLNLNVDLAELLLFPLVLVQGLRQFALCLVRHAIVETLDGLRCEQALFHAIEQGSFQILPSSANEYFVP